MILKIQNRCIYFHLPVYWPALWSSRCSQLDRLLELYPVFPSRSPVSLPRIWSSRSSATASSNHVIRREWRHRPGRNRSRRETRRRSAPRDTASSCNNFSADRWRNSVQHFRLLRVLVSTWLGPDCQKSRQSSFDAYCCSRVDFDILSMGICIRELWWVFLQRCILKQGTFILCN